MKFLIWPGTYSRIRPFGLSPAIFVPGLFFILFGLSLVFAPRLILSLVAAFLIVIGLMFFYVAYKFVQLKRNFENFSRSFGNVQIKTFQYGKSTSHHDESNEPRGTTTVLKNGEKITFH